MRVWYRFLYTMVSGVTAAIARLLSSRRRLTGCCGLPLPGFAGCCNGIQIAGFVFAFRSFSYLDKWEFMGLPAGLAVISRKARSRGTWKG